MSADFLEAVILGCGSSTGVPRLGGANGAGEWGACDPANPKNRRRRCSLLVRRAATTVLVDTSPDLREQLLSARCSRLDAVLVTHPHADQINGIDDLRALTFGHGRKIPVHGDRATMELVQRQFAYCFVPMNGYPAIATAHVLSEPFSEMRIGGQGEEIPAIAFWQRHGPIDSLGYRFGPLAYSSDVVELDEAAFDVLEGVDTWIVDSLRYHQHPTHANVETALRWIERVKPRHAVLTNLNIEIDYGKLKSELPEGVEPAYDGMVLRVPL